MADTCANEQTKKRKEEKENKPRRTQQSKPMCKCSYCGHSRLLLLSGISLSVCSLRLSTSAGHSRLPGSERTQQKSHPTQRGWEGRLTGEAHSQG